MISRCCCVPARPTPQSDFAEPRTTTRRQSWSPAELEKAVCFGNQILACAQERVGQASAEQREKIFDLCGRLKGWLQDETADSNYRTPQIRDLGRALLALLYVSRLVEAGEVATLKQGL